ncbi:MAG: NAD-dependent epimerase/dehydratase family protein [Ignavibacteriales bacterium]|nr:NAD-dependent epimerase/dehydratase family protein [Ignavibacteriales bacterium]
MKILVIGGTGFISGRLVKKLLAKGHTVSVVTRRHTAPSAFDPTKVRFLTADRTKEAELKNVLGNQTFDAVYDMIDYEPGESEAAVRIFKGRTGRFIHCSTVSVYMVSNDIRCPVTEDQDRTPLMKHFPRNPFGMDYGIRKRKCEEVLWEAHDAKTFPVSMLRPTFVCGPGDPAKRDFFWIERILDGQPLLVPGTGDHAFQQVYVEDVAVAFARLLERDDSIGHAFNVAAEEVMSLNDYLRRLSELLNRSPEIIHVDQEMFDTLPFSVSRNGDVFPFNTRRTAFFSLGRIKERLGFRATEFSEWMPETIAWFREKQKGHSNGYEHRHAEIAFAVRWKQGIEQLRKGMNV